MYTATYPQDSTLRRHYESAKRFAADRPPSDSVLRRHYEQRRLAITQGSVRAAAPRPAPAPKPAPAATPARKPQQPATTREARNDGGFFAWLKRFFG